MATCVEEAADLPIFPSHDKYRLPADVGREEKVSLSQLGFEPDKYPTGLEYGAQFTLTEVLVDKDRAIDCERSRARPVPDQFIHDILQGDVQRHSAECC